MTTFERVAEHAATKRTQQSTEYERVRGPFQRSWHGEIKVRAMWGQVAERSGKQLLADRGPLASDAPGSQLPTQSAGASLIQQRLESKHDGALKQHRVEVDDCTRQQHP